MTAVAGLAGGAWVVDRGWLVGGGAGLLSWSGWVVYTFVVAPAPTRELLRILGTLFGNIPGAAVVGATVLLGAVLGATGGWIGSETARWMKHRSVAA